MVLGRSPDDALNSKQFEIFSISGSTWRPRSKVRGGCSRGPGQRRVRIHSKSKNNWGGGCQVKVRVKGERGDRIKVKVKHV